MREERLRIEVDLKRATLAGVALGSRPAALSKLGSPDNGKPLALDRSSRKEDVVRQLGEPWHEYADPDDDEIGLTLWYETRTLEWAFDFLPVGTLSSIALASPPGMADEKTRGYLKCAKPWPP